MGSGDYTMRRRVIGKRQLDPPQMHSSKGGFRVRHREFITDVPSSQAFIVGAFSLNPGLAGTFPWLASIASNFEEWTPNGIVFQFKTTSSDSVVSTNANAALGAVIMATEYNPYNGNFGNKQQMENYEFAQSCKPSCDLMHAVECKKTQNPLGSYFVRTGSVPSTQDARFYDLGTTQVASVGMQSNGGTIGELWVTYDITFRKPKIQIGQSGGDTNVGGSFDHFSSGANTTALGATPFGTATAGFTFPTTNSTLGGVVSGGVVPAASAASNYSTPTRNNFQGGVAVLDGNGNPTGARGASVANTYYFPPGVSNGNYMIYLINNGSGSGAVTAVTTNFTNCTGLGLIRSDNDSGAIVVGSAGVTTHSLILFLTVTKANANFNVSFTSTITTPVYWDLYVSEIPPAIN